MQDDEDGLQTLASYNVPRDLHVESEMGDRGNSQASLARYKRILPDIDQEALAATNGSYLQAAPLVGCTTHAWYNEWLKLSTRTKSRAHSPQHVRFDFRGVTDARQFCPEAFVQLTPPSLWQHTYRIAFNTHRSTAFNTQ